MEAAEFREITIADPGDLTIEIIEYSDGNAFVPQPDLYKNEDDSLDLMPTAKAWIRVDKEKLMNSTQYFKKMFEKPWAEQNRKVISLTGDTIMSMEIWFPFFHLSPQSTPSSLPVESVSIVDVWHVIAASEKYKFNREKMTPWFAKWYAGHSQGIEDNTKLLKETLYPCFAFTTHAVSNKLQTHWRTEVGVIYLNAIQHVSATCMSQLGSFINLEQVNAARGRLRNVIHNGLFTNDISKAAERGDTYRGLQDIRYRDVYSDIATILSSATCPCKEKTVFNYFRELQRVGIWPLEDSLKRNSINDVLAGMEDFDGSNVRGNVSTVPGAETTATSVSQTSPVAGANKCKRCSQDWEKVVLNAMDRTEAYFDGLCLDCMDRTRNIRLKNGNEDDDYWRHGWRRQEYDGRCRVRHGDPTWSFSFMGAGRSTRTELVVKGQGKHV